MAALGLAFDSPRKKESRLAFSASSWAELAPAALSALLSERRENERWCDLGRRLSDAVDWSMLDA